MLAIYARQRIVLEPQSLDDVPGKAVGEAKGHELNRLGRVEVRQVAPRVPASG